MVLGENSTQNKINPQIKIASAHIHIPRNNPAKFHDNQMESLGKISDKRFRTEEKG